MRAFLVTLILLITPVLVIATEPLPDWLDKKLNETPINTTQDYTGKITETANPALATRIDEINKYQYKGMTTYLVPGGCCDTYTSLYDAEGNYICAPSGGLSGRGDGTCPDFMKEATDKEVVWQKKQ